MKKIRKLLAGFMMLAMVISLIPMLAPITAHADTPTSLIDNTKDGQCSLTVYKYEVNSEYDSGKTATGDLQQVDGDATALSDVGFKLYYVESIDDYFEEGGKSVPSGKAVSTAGFELIEHEKTTDDAGKVTWSELGFGIYYVEESTPPQNAISDPVGFYVSLPLTNSTEDGWLYNVTVYPKNTITRGGLTLKKTGNGATITDTAKFVLQYKENSSDTSWQYVSKNGNEYVYGATSSVFQVATAGTEFTNLKKGFYRFIEVEAPNSFYIMDGNTTYDFEIKADGSIDYEDANYGLSTCDETNKIITIDNQKPEVEKKVWKKDRSVSSNDSWADYADYSVGDSVQFEITADVPDNIADLKHYILKDTMSTGLASPTNITIAYKDKDNNGVDVSSTGLPTTLSGSDVVSTGWTLDLSDSNKTSALSAKKIKKVVVTFSATLTADATTAGTGNPNDVTLEYTNKILPDASTGDVANPNKPDSGDGNAPKEETITIVDRVVVYTFGIQLTKTFEGESASDNINATFDLYKKDVDGTVTITDPDNTSQTIAVTKIGTYTTDNQGKIIIDTTQTENPDNDKALALDTYYFVETSTADGYNLLKYPVKITVDTTYEPTITTTQTITKKYNDSSELIGNAEKLGSLTTVANNSMTLESGSATIAENIDVVNNKGFTLPVTGGVGTYIFIFVGVSMMAAAVILFFVTKKKDLKKGV